MIISRHNVHWNAVELALRIGSLVSAIFVVFVWVAPPWPEFGWHLALGPPALTAAIQTVAQEDDPDLSWDALSARNEGNPAGGRGKVIAGDVLILPITGFNPDRGWFQNMGSQSITHPNARLRHAAAGSWRSTDLKVHWGKFCRQAFGFCREWSKISEVEV